MHLSIALPTILIVSYALLVLWLLFGLRERRVPEQVVANLPRLLRCSIVLDGLVNAGKTCLVERILTPHIPFRQLSRSQRVTISEYWPIGWRKGSGKRELYCANFIDIPGDSTEEFSVNVGNIREKELGVLIIVVSAENSEDAITRRLTRDYIMRAYGPPPIRKRIRGVIIFFNKIDIVYNTFQSQNEIRNYRQEIAIRLDQSFKALDELYPQRVRITFGSVKTNEGLLDLLGSIYELSGIANDTEQMESIRTLPADVIDDKNSEKTLPHATIPR